MEAERCRHELLVEQCADCRPAPAVDPLSDPAERPHRAVWFEARYGGTCCECGDRFDAGDAIRSVGMGEYECANCGGAPL
jgi:hypothetical protein